ncbi:protein of unknown function [Azospirillum baldaniorum]|uniref:Uncharacterized protein n=1 Tax=Azospirillum baldaniorum TaxID=1064539 RepID=A0A9P1JP01_9PROT|nr:protein of unknown function [Azospirillum baldaniorum]
MTDRRNTPHIVVSGRLPPPMDGMSRVTALVLDRLRDRGPVQATVEVADLSPGLERRRPALPRGEGHARPAGGLAAGGRGDDPRTAFLHARRFGAGDLLHGGAGRNGAAVRL